MKKKKYPANSGSSRLLPVAVLLSFIILSLLPQCASSFATQPSSSSAAAAAAPIITPDNIQLPILYENDHLIAISKPPHIPHHDDPQSHQLGILSLLRHQQQSHTFAYPSRLYGVHRLDRVTSGILLLAKSSTVANALVTKFKERQVTKYYMAVSGKKPRKKKQGWVKGRMVLGRRGSFKLVNTENKKEEDEMSSGNYAVTRFYTAGLGNLPLSPLVQQEVDDEEEQGSSLSSSTASSAIPKTAILFQPHTGKTHQLRVAAKSVGLPLLGDGRYGGGRVYLCCSVGNNDDRTTRDTELLFDRTYLHAAAIHFELDGEEVCIYSPPPFGHLFSSSSELEDVFVGMMKKHCRDDDPILHHVENFKTL
ncbi:hypothetical protein ACHAWT_000919 [Skeletonema menzelii]